VFPAIATSPLRFSAKLGTVARTRCLRVWRSGLFGQFRVAVLTACAAFAHANRHTAVATLQRAARKPRDGLDGRVSFDSIPSTSSAHTLSHPIARGIIH
jgi:hypothetical protein